MLPGRSLGTLVMVELAAEHGARAWFLKAPFRLWRMLVLMPYPWLPARTLLRRLTPMVTARLTLTCSYTCTQIPPFRQGFRLVSPHSGDKSICET